MSRLRRLVRGYLRRVEFLMIFDIVKQPGICGTLRSPPRPAYGTASSGDDRREARSKAPISRSYSASGAP